MCGTCLFAINAVNNPIAMRTRHASTSSGSHSGPDSPMVTLSDFNFPLMQPGTPVTLGAGLPGATAPDTDQSALGASGMAPLAPADPLTSIFNKLEEMNRGDMIFESNVEAKLAKYEENSDARLAAFQNDISTKLQALERLPALTQKVDSVVADVASLGERFSNLQTEHQQLRATVTELTNVGASGEIPETVAARLDAIEASMKEYAGSLARINVERTKLCPDIVVSGLQLPEGVDRGSLAFAVLRDVLPSVQQGSIVNVRPLLPKLPARPTEDGAGSAAAAGDAVSGPVPLLVTLLSGEVAHNLVVAKVKLGKLHSSTLNEELVLASGASLPLPSSLINIYEFLPQDLYNFRRAVKDDAKKTAFSTFIQDGAIFIKKRKEHTGTRISSMADLKNFLTGS